MNPEISDRVCRFLYVFRGKLIEEEREILSDEDELDIRPRTLWPDDDTTEHVARDEDYDISPFNSQDPRTRLPWTSECVEEYSPQTNEFIPATHIYTEKSEEGEEADVDEHDQAPVTRNDDHKRESKSTRPRTANKTEHRPKMKPKQPQGHRELEQSAQSENQQPEPQPAQRVSNTSQPHIHNGEGGNARDKGLEPRSYSKGSKEQDIQKTPPKRHSKTFEPDSIQPTEDMHDATPRRTYTVYEPDSLQTTEEVQSATPRRTSKTFEPDSLQPTEEDGHQSPEFTKRQQKNRLAVSEDSYYQPTISTNEEDEYNRRSRSQTPEPTAYDSQRYRQETPEPPVRPNYADYGDDVNDNPGEIDRGYRSETVVKVLNGDELEDDHHHHTFRSSSSPTPPSSTLSSPLTRAIPLDNPFQDIPDTRNARLVSEERENRRLESRDKLAYVLRGHKYGVSPSLYEYNTPSELFGPRVLWPKRTTSPSRAGQCQRRLGHLDYNDSRDGPPISPSYYNTDTPTALGTSLSWSNTQLSPLASVLQSEYELPESPTDEYGQEQQQQQFQRQNQKPFHYPYPCPYPPVPCVSGGGGGSSMYGSCDSVSQTQQSSHYEEYFATVKNQPLKLTPPEKHARDEDDGEDCRENEREGHLCESFDRCWGIRQHTVGVYYWSEERRPFTESRIDKIQVLRRCIEVA
ncbi:hypothetical protein BGX26_006731 [Mortierella sp. AD094]|nr:hypothetical protein BGX26_006731 [Mortierella sp. AD094]